MKRVVLFSLAGIWLLCNGSSIVWAQSTAQISGTVTDQSGGIEQVVGRITKVVIIKGTPILDKMLTAGTEPEP